jgi:hypothetical protein
MADAKDDEPPPKVPFYYSNEHDQGMGVPGRCRCGGPLDLKALGWTCSRCGTGYGRSDR